LILDRLKVSIKLEDAETISYQGHEADTPRIRDTPTPLPRAPSTPAPRPVSSPPVVPVAPVFTPAASPAFGGYAEPVSGAHTSVEPVVEAPLIAPVTDHTERDAVQIKKSRGLFIAVSVIVLGIAMILSFVLIKVLKGSGSSPDAAVVAVADAAAPSPDVALPAAEPDARAGVEPDAAVPADAAAVVDATAGEPDAATVVPPPDAAVARPDAGIIPDRPRPRPPRLVLDIQNAGATTTISINGRRAGAGRHFERELVLEQTLWIEVVSIARKPYRFSVRATAARPVVNMTIRLQEDLLDPTK
jgi:hypothetical protein